LREKLKVSQLSNLSRKAKASKSNELIDQHVIT
jgi:hypothetical protein